MPRPRPLLRPGSGAPTLRIHHRLSENPAARAEWGGERRLFAGRGAVYPLTPRGAVPEAAPHPASHSGPNSENRDLKAYSLGEKKIPVPGGLEGKTHGEDSQGQLHPMLTSS